MTELSHRIEEQSIIIDSLQLKTPQQILDSSIQMYQRDLEQLNSKLLLRYQGAIDEQGENIRETIRKKTQEHTRSIQMLYDAVHVKEVEVSKALRTGVWIEYELATDTGTTFGHVTHKSKIFLGATHPDQILRPLYSDPHKYLSEIVRPKAGERGLRLISVTPVGFHPEEWKKLPLESFHQGPQSYDYDYEWCGLD